jgi:hypothetical protein
MIPTLALLFSLTFAQAAQPTFGAYCPRGQEVPVFRNGFLALYEQLGPNIMGLAYTCEFPDPRGTGDTLQWTFRGLAFWRKSTNTPTFTDGNTHWALQAVAPTGIVWWNGTSIDPPANANPGRAQGDPAVLCSLGLIDC